MNRPPFELWPIAPKGFMGAKQKHFLSSEAEIAAYDKWWTDILRNQFDDEEAIRYEVIKPLREFVMQNYRIVQMFGRHVLFERK